MMQPLFGSPRRPAEARSQTSARIASRGPPCSICVLTLPSPATDAAGTIARADRAPRQPRPLIGMEARMRAHRLFSFRTLSVVVAAALLILSGLKVGEAIVQDDTASEAATATQPAPRLVLTGLLSSEKVSPSLTAYGQIKARRILEIRPSVAGRLADVSERMLAGGFVEKGELLFRVDPDAAARKVRRRKPPLPKPKRTCIGSRQPAVPGPTSRGVSARPGLAQAERGTQGHARKPPADFVDAP